MVHSVLRWRTESTRGRNHMPICVGMQSVNMRHMKESRIAFENPHHIPPFSMVSELWLTLPSVITRVRFFFAFSKDKRYRDFTPVIACCRPILLGFYAGS